MNVVIVEEAESKSAEVGGTGGVVVVEEEEFRPAEEVFHDPSELDFLMQHGGGSTDGIALARQSLFVKFDPLVSGRPSMFHSPRPTSNAGTTTITITAKLSAANTTNYYF